MKEQREEPEAEARSFFQALGLTVEHLERVGRKAPDFRVLGDGPGYLVEVKARYDDEEASRTLKTAGTAAHVRTLGHDDAVERIARRARRQLEAEDPNREHVWLLWLDARAVMGADALRDQLIATLYGIRHAVFEDDVGDTVSLHCYYARPGVLERWSDLDAAVVAGHGGWLLCLNEFSPRAQEVRALRLTREFERRSAVIVPAELERAGGAMLAPTSLDRRVEPVLTAYLREHYRHPELLILDPYQATASALVRREGKHR